MKKILFLILLLFSLTCWADNPNPCPPPPSDHPSHPPHPGAPIGGGTWMLLVMGAMYGGYKYYKVKHNLKEQI